METLQDLCDELRTLSSRAGVRAANRVTKRGLGRHVYVDWPESTPLALWALCTTPVDLLVIPQFGRSSLRCVVQALHAHGLALSTGRYA